MESQGENSDLLVEVLLKWFAVNARDLPWRREPYRSNPYCVYVSEVMLQQTQVKTVIPYWTRFTSELPDVAALAAAPEEKLLKLWEGLGYYSRVRNLQKAARVLMDQHAGHLPSSVDQLMTLPGIGRYTAGAIASIAFNQPAPILDGNVIRVLSRIFGIRGNPKKSPPAEVFWGKATELVERAANFEDHFERACGKLNESLMELGALVCTPQQPACDRCPAKKHCFAFRNSCVENLPELEKRVAQTERTFVALVFLRGSKTLVRRRAEGQVNAGLWEFPNIELATAGGLRRQLTELAVGLPTRKFAEIKHTITRYRITLSVYSAMVEDPASARDLQEKLGGKWLSLGAASRLPFSSAHARIRQQLLRPGR